MKIDPVRFDFAGLSEMLYRVHSKKSAKEAVSIFMAALTGAMQAGLRIMADKTRRLDAREDVEAFAAWWTVREAGADGVDMAPDALTISTAQGLFQRFCAWALARCVWHRMTLLKLCPDASCANPANANAAFIGLLASDPRTIGDERHKRFIEQARLIHAASPLAWAMYRKYAARRGGEDFTQWKNPAMDQWLILIWPLAFRQGWNFRDVLNVVMEKFPDYRPGESDFGKHCRRLGLKLAHKPGHPRNRTLSKKHIQLALAIGT